MALVVATVQNLPWLLLLPQQSAPLDCILWHLHLLHVLRHLMRVEDAGHADLDLALLLLGCLQRGLALLQEEVAVILARELTDLDQEVPEVLLEGGYVLVQVEQALDRDLDLVVQEVRESGAEEVGRKVLRERKEI